MQRLDATLIWILSCITGICVMLVILMCTYFCRREHFAFLRQVVLRMCPFCHGPEQELSDGEMAELPELVFMIPNGITVHSTAYQWNSKTNEGFVKLSTAIPDQYYKNAILSVITHVSMKECVLEAQLEGKFTKEDTVMITCTKGKRERSQYEKVVLSNTGIEPLQDEENLLRGEVTEENGWWG